MQLFKIKRADDSFISQIISVSYTETVNSGIDLRPGTVGGASIEVEAFGSISDAPAAGEQLTVYPYDSNEALAIVFAGIPEIRTKNSYRFSAFDNVSKLDVDFSGWLAEHQDSFPMTAKALVQQALTLTGLSLGTSTWTGYNVNVNAFFADGLTCRDILSYAAELSGCYVHCHGDGLLYFHWYTTTPDTRIYPTSGTDGDETRYAYKQDGLSYANYTVPVVDGVAVHPVGEDDVAFIYPASPAGDNLLHIRNNPLLTNATATVYTNAAQRIYNRMVTAGAYTPMTADLFPRECPYRAGDIVNVTDSQGQSFRSLVMTLNVNGTAATLESTGNERQDDSAYDTHKAIVQLASDIVQIDRLKVGYAEIAQAVIDVLIANDITAQNLTIVDENGNVLATYDASGITLGQADEAHAAINFNSFDLYDKDGNRYLHFGDARNASGRANVRWLGYENAAVIPYVSPTLPGLYSVIAVYVGGQLVDPSNYTYDTTTMKVTINTGVSDAEVDIRYVTTSPVYAYTLGYRNTDYYNGKQSLTVGRDIGCSAGDSLAVGLSHTVVGQYNCALGGNGADIRGNYSVTLGGRGLIARSSSQVVLGEYNMADRSYVSQRGDYVEIVGNGANSSTRSNARTLDWSGNEWLAGQINADTGNFRNGASSSGNIDITGGWFVRRLPAAISSGTAYRGVQFTESNGTTGRGGLIFYRSSYGDGVRVASAAEVNGSTVNNMLTLYVDDSGNRSVTVSEVNPWLKALGLAYFPGDSFTLSSTSYTPFAGEMRTDKIFYFTIPLTKSVASSVSTISISGTVLMIGVNTSAKYKSVVLNDPSSAPLDACNATVQSNAAGLAVRCEFAVSQSSWWTTQTPIAVQANGMTVSFS